MLHKLFRLRKNVAFLVLALAGVSAGVTSLAAQTPESGSTVAARIIGPIKEDSVVTLSGNTHPLAKAKYDQGAAPVSMPVKRMLLVLKRSPQQEAGLKSYLDSLQDPNSPNYHKFLTPEQFGAQYGPADSDVQTVSAWLQGHGFAVARTNKAKTAIEFSGNVGQLQEAFHTSIHSYLVKGVQHYANASDPQVPAALAPVVAGVAHMNDFFAKSQAVRGPRGQYDPKSKSFKPLLTAGSGSDQFLYVGPADAATIYDSPSSTLNRNFAGGTSYDGTGVTIGIAGEGNIDPTAVANYRTFFGLPANAPTVIVDGDDPGIGDVDETATGEALLDVEIAGGVAPGAKINLYVSAGTALQEGLDFAILRALDDNVVNILNVSFGLCEAYDGTSGNALNYNQWEEAAAQGISVTVSTGDNGSAGCDDANSETEAVNGLNVSGLASTPYNIAVGGTDYDVLANNFSTYVQSTNPAPYFGTATKYIPENPWNNSTSNNTTLSANQAYVDPNTGDTSIAAASGGASSCATSTTDSAGDIFCKGGYAKPSWQTALTPKDTVRDLPDVSMLSSNGFYGATWAICATGTEDGQPVDDCQLNSSGSTTVTGFGGTSAAAPAFAGALAIVNQKVGGRLGQANNVLYALASQTPAIFHDVKTGNNSVLCASGSPDCASNNFLTGYDAGTGYDLASGLGSVDITALANGWKALTFAPSTTSLTLNGATARLTLTHGANVKVDVAVTSAGHTPTGDVALVDTLEVTANPNNAAIGALTLGSSGSVSSTVNYLPGGSYSVMAHYPGDGTVGASLSNPVLVDVTPEPSTLSLQVASYDASTGQSVAGAVYGFFTVVDATPGNSTASDGVATGSVTFTVPGAGTQTEPVNSAGFSEIQTETLPVGAETIAASYSGDNSFDKSSGSVAVTVTKGQTATSVTPSAQSISASASASLTVTIATDSVGAGPTGTITVKAGSTTLGTSPLIPVAGSASGLASATASVFIPGSQLAVGANSITAVYSGDSNYSGSTAPAVSVSVTSGTAAGFTITANPATLSFAHGSTSGNTTQITVTPVGGYTGTVDLACAITSSPSGAQDKPSCTLGNATITSAAATTVTLTVSSTASSALQMPSSPFGWSAAGGTALALVVFFGIPARRRGWKGILTLALFAAVASVAIGCGGSSSSGGGNTGTTAGTYTATITGTDSKVASEKASVTVAVNIN